jgi:uncharacterized protein (UPF0276 family)
MRQLSFGDRVGLGWRPELAAGILSHLDEIDVVEVLIEDCLHASRRERQGLAFLARHVPVMYHGVSLGLASAHAIDSRRLDRVARFLDAMNADVWSEHLAFVRAGGIEIGHLAAPPRAQWSVDGACENLRRIEQVVGTVPALENIATLLEPPGSTLTEPQWINAIASQASAPLLLDLHNLLCNAVNSGGDPAQYLEGFPLGPVTTVHLSGGQWIAQGRRLLDDHLHPVPPLVFELLEQMAGRVHQPLTVIIERDGNYPPFQKLLNELRMARRALAAGRSHELACV